MFFALIFFLSSRAKTKLPSHQIYVGLWMAVTIEMACSSLFSPRLALVHPPPLPQVRSPIATFDVLPHLRRILRVSFSRRRRRLHRRRATTIFPSTVCREFFPISIPCTPSLFLPLPFFLSPFTIVRRHPFRSVLYS